MLFGNIKTAGKTAKELVVDKEIVVFEEEKVSIYTRLILWKGVIRRFFLYTFNKRYIEKKFSKRQGKCLRCGACCKLVFKKCPYLKTAIDGKTSCVKHASFRMPNCIIFPIDNNDLKDRNKISNKPCGYSFE